MPPDRGLENCEDEQKDTRTGWPMNRALPPLDWATAPKKSQPATDALSRELIQGQLNRVLAAAQFRDSLRLTRFLSFVVATTLAGKTDCIKAYTIATEALDRGGDFDPQNDPIVRVEAGRLRQALARYYAKDGRNDPVLIELPRGTYVPTFYSRTSALPQGVARADPAFESATPKTPNPQFGGTQEFRRSVTENIELVRSQREQISELSGVIRSARETLNESCALLKASAQSVAGGCLDKRADTGWHEDSRLAPLPGRPPQPEPPRQASSIWQIRNPIAPLTSRMGAKARLFKIAFATIAVLAILEMLFDIDHPLVGGPNHGLRYSLRPVTNAAARLDSAREGAPAIYVGPVATAGQQIPGFLPAAMVRERLIHALARYDDVTVVTDEPDIAANRGAAAAEPGLPASIYRLTSTIRYDDKGAVLIVQLLDTATGSIAWTRQYDHPIKPDPRRQSGLIALDVARSLLDPFGVIQARERVKLAAADPTKDTYRCILDASEYLRSFNPSQYRPVRDCLVQASERTPPAVTVFADLAFVYLRNYRFGVVAAPGDPTMLDNAYAMAARAVDIKPESAFAQYALGAVLLAKGDIAQAKIASEKSYALNPDNGAVAFGRAMMLVLTGDVDAGLALLDKNAVKSSNSWIGYHVFKALGCYLKGDLKAAGAESRQIANPFFPPGLMLDGLIADKSGDRARAQQDIAMLYQFYPAWRQNFRASVSRYLPEPMAERLAADFNAAAPDTMQ